MGLPKIDSKILDDLTIRFIISAKEFITLNPEEYFFILEEAHWFAIDFYDIPPMSLPTFASILLSYSGIELNINKDYPAFKTYKQTIHVYGTMIFSRDFTHCLLVQQQGSSNAITFPKGKKSRNETGIECAIRETREEVGINVTDKIIDLSVTIFDKITLYFAFNVDMSVPLKTNTRNEISNIFWFDLSKLQTVKNKKNYKLFITAYHQAVKIIAGLKNTYFKFDMGRIGNAIKKSL
ncbi:mRNA-decapping enzyme subunit 2 [Pancytospora epiphaga]|nr:mRNA-decapping enzyme subunit 2 [Pancytospora epiphaga]